MAYYLVQAQPDKARLKDLLARLESGEISEMRPFGTALHHSLTHARLQADGSAIWEEEDYCSPPLAMERAAVLDTYFSGIEVQPVEKGKGWQQIEMLDSLWEETQPE